MFNDKNMHVGDTRLRAVGNRATIAALKMQNNPQAMTDADYKTISNRKWAESQARQRGGKIESSIDDLWGEKSFGAMQARANSQANAEGSMAAKYGGGNIGLVKKANMQSFKEDFHHNSAIRTFELKSASAKARSDRAGAHKAEFENRYLARDKRNEYKDRTLRNAGIRTGIAERNQAMNIRSQTHNWNIRDRQNEQTAAMMQERANRDYWAGARDVYAKAYPNAPEIALSSRENFERWQRDGFAPNPILGTQVAGNSNMIYTSPNSATYSRENSDPTVSAPDGRTPFFDNETGQWIAPTLPSVLDLEGNISGGGFNPEYNALTARARGLTKSPVVTSGAKNQSSYDWLGGAR